MKSRSVLLASAMVFVLAVASAPLFSQGAWKMLFNGKDFTGWTIQAYGQRPGRRNRADRGATPKAPAAPMSTDPGMGVIRHADAGYDEAISFAREHGIARPMESD